MRSKLISILTVFLISLSSTISSKDITIKGTIRDDSGEIIIGVSIQQKGTSKGTVSNIDGLYSITVPSKSTLVFTYLGYASQEIIVSESKVLDVVLHLDNTSLDEVAVVGYGTVKKKTLTGAVSRVSSEKIASDERAYEMPSMDEISVSSTDRKSYNRQNSGRGGLLTATEVNDFKKWDEWAPLLQGEFSSYTNVWKMIPQTRFVATAIDKNQKTIPNVVVTLYDSSQKAIWTTKTDNSGTAQLWADYIVNQQSAKSKKPYSITFKLNNETRTIDKAQPYPQQTNVAKFGTQARISNDVDIFFTIDATGSMSDELSYVQTELYNIIERVKQNQNQLNVKMGALVYRDHGDEYLTKNTPLSTDINTTINFLKQQRADGGGDTPEAVDEALYQTVEKENWNENALSRIVFIILDAPAHNDSKSVEQIQKQLLLAAKKGIRIIPLVASGMEKDGEYLMRSIALATNGTYVTLTDDSGVGDSHIKPSTEYSKIEKMNDLIVRLINEYTKVPSTI